MALDNRYFKQSSCFRHYRALLHKIFIVYLLTTSAMNDDTRIAIRS